jgi:hypothetical protein
VVQLGAAATTITYLTSTARESSELLKEEIVRPTYVRLTVSRKLLHYIRRYLRTRGRGGVPPHEEGIEAPLIGILLSRDSKRDQHKYGK